MHACLRYLSGCVHPPCTTCSDTHTACSLQPNKGITLDASPPSGIEGPPPSNTVWTDVLDLGVQGRGWDANVLNSPFNRCVVQ